VGTDPLALDRDVAGATARLLLTAAGLDDVAVRAASPLAGWTRGHVLTHLARNADGATNLLTWARTGVETPQYASLAQRAADIEAGADRPAAAQLEDLDAACARFAAAVSAMPVAAWSTVVRWTDGRESPAAQVMWRRLREVEIHHVDLGTGYQPADWPEAFTLRLLRGVARDLSGRHQSGRNQSGRDLSDRGPRFVIRSPEVGHDVEVGAGATAPVVSGPAWAAAAWLVGRGGSTELTVEPPGALPVVPPLG
jgi:maleylpyruvate isomerase